MKEMEHLFWCYHKLTTYQHHYWQVCWLHSETLRSYQLNAPLCPSCFLWVQQSLNSHEVDHKAKQNNNKKADFFHWWWLFPHVQEFWLYVWQFIPCLRVLVEIRSCTQISLLKSQDQSTLAQQAEMTVAKCSLTNVCELVSWYVPTLCLNSSIVSPLWLH